MRSDTVRLHHHMSQMRRGNEPGSELSSLNDSARYRSGILIFSRRQKLLHGNCRALELIGYLNQPECVPECDFHVVPVCELRDSIQAALDHRRAANTWEPFELKRVFFEPRCKIVVRGLGLADRDSHDDSCIVIVLEEVRLRRESNEPQRQAMGLSQKRSGADTLGSAQLGSAHGVFDVGMDGAP